MPMSAQLRSRAPSYPSTARPSHEVLAAHSAAGQAVHSEKADVLGDWQWLEHSCRAAASHGSDSRLLSVPVPTLVWSRLPPASVENEKHWLTDRSGGTCVTETENPTQQRRLGSQAAAAAMENEEHRNMDGACWIGTKPCTCTGAAA
jgi:hypothetical protein